MGGEERAHFPRQRGVFRLHPVEQRVPGGGVQLQRLVEEGV